MLPGHKHHVEATDKWIRFNFLYLWDCGDEKIVDILVMHGFISVTFFFITVEYY